MINAIIFDFDGVLFDSEIVHFQAINIMLKHLGISLSHTDYLKKYVGLADEETVPAILATNNIHLAQNEIAELIAEKINIYNKIIIESDDINCVKGVDELLQNAAKKINKLGICSNSNYIELQAALSRMQKGKLRQYFQCITTINDVTQGKPSPEGYLKTASCLQVAPENCLVIEDSQYGIRAAKAANMRVIGIATTHKKDALSEADYIMQDFTEINEWISKI